AGRQVSVESAVRDRACARSVQGEEDRSGARRDRALHDGAGEEAVAVLQQDAGEAVRFVRSMREGSREARPRAPLCDAGASGELPAARGRDRRPQRRVNKVVVMGKVPRPGEVKTRLAAPSIAVRLYRAFLWDVFEMVGERGIFACAGGSFEEACTLAPL